MNNSQLRALLFYCCITFIPLMAYSQANDAGISAIVSPSSNFCAASQSITVRLKNFGSKALKTATVNWRLNGVLQTSYYFSGSLATNATTDIVLNSSYAFAAGAYTIKSWSTNPNGAGSDPRPSNDTSSYSFTVYPLAVANAGTSQSICKGSSATIGGASDPNFSYSWSNGVTTSSQTVSPLFTTTYSLTVTEVHGCGTASASVTITVIDPPVASITALTTICSGYALNLISSNGSSSGPGYTRRWSGTNSFTGSDNCTDYPDVTYTCGTGQVTYTLTVADVGGICNPATATVTVNVIAPAASNPYASKNIACQGESITLHAGCSGYYLYEWTYNGTVIGSVPDLTVTVPNATACGMNTITYNLKVEDIYGCTTASGSVSIEVVGPPIASAHADNSSICSGDPVHLSTSGSCSDRSIYEVEWTGNGFLSYNDNATDNPTATTTYSLTVSDIYGCSSVVDNVTVVVNDKPSVTVSTTNQSDENTCDGTATAAVSGGTPPYTYAWDNGGSNQTIENLCQNSYSVVVTDANGCTAYDFGYVDVPVTLVYFKARRQGRYVHLSWQTASEINNAFFDIQRSVDGINWVKVGQEAGHGNSVEIHDYSYEDYGIEGALSEKVYYRLKQVDYNGKFEYSPVRSLALNTETNDEVSSWYSASLSSLHIEMDIEESLPAIISFTDVNGKVLKQEKRLLQAGSNQFGISTESLPQGMYLCKIQYGTNQYTTKFLR